MDAVAMVASIGQFCSPLSASVCRRRVRGYWDSQFAKTERTGARLMLTCCEPRTNSFLVRVLPVRASSRSSPHSARSARLADDARSARTRATRIAAPLLQPDEPGDVDAVDECDIASVTARFVVFELARAFCLCHAHLAGDVVSSRANFFLTFSTARSADNYASSSDIMGDYPRSATLDLADCRSVRDFLHNRDKDVLSAS